MSETIEIPKPKRVYKKKVVEAPEVALSPDDQSIELPKRKYQRRQSKDGIATPLDTRKPKETPIIDKAPEPEPTIPFPDPIPSPTTESDSPTRGRTSDDSSSPDGSQRDRGSEDEAPSPQRRQSKDGIATPLDIVPQKKPRTDKQIAAFNRMREARLKKQAELDHLKEVAKHQVLIDKNQKKIEKIEDQIRIHKEPSPLSGDVIKKKASRKTSSRVTAPVDPDTESEYNEPPPYTSEANHMAHRPKSLSHIQVSTLKPILFM